MISDLKWMIGSSLRNARKIEYTWSFQFDNGAAITVTESPWRLVGPDAIVVTSEDHGHQFGLPVPVNAEQTLNRNLVGKAVKNIIVKETTGDLILIIGTSSLEFLCLSTGYEAWHLTSTNLELVCVGGGRVLKIEAERDNRTRR